MKVAVLSFASPAARREYLAALRKRMREVGYASDYVSDWIHALFDPVLPVAHVFGRDDAERAADVAGEVRGVSCKMENAQ